jgi:predicted membrane chloride channel (bestrophin family)
MGHDAKLKDAILATSHQSRASACVAELQRTVEFARKNALVSDEAAFDCYNHCENFLQSQTTILRVVDTPVPTLYRHIALTALFFYAFSAPFSFASTFGWLSPVPSAVLVLGFYGAAAVGEELIDPLAWSTHAHDGNRASKRVFLDNDVIYSA